MRRGRSEGDAARKISAGARVKQGERSCAMGNDPKVREKEALQRSTNPDMNREGQEWRGTGTERDRQEQTGTDMDRQELTGTDKNRQGQTGTDRDRQEPTGTDRNRQGQTGTDRHQT